MVDVYISRRFGGVTLPCFAYWLVLHVQHARRQFSFQCGASLFYRSIVTLCDMSGLCGCGSLCITTLHLQHMLSCSHHWSSNQSTVIHSSQFDSLWSPRSRSNSGQFLRASAILLRLMDDCTLYDDLIQPCFVSSLIHNC